MPKYIYNGPIYRNGQKVESNKQLFTDAPSIAKARANFIYQVGTGYDILYNCISEFAPTWEEEHPDRVCPDCGNLLQDSGDCPLCDNNDYSICDEIKLMRYVDDIEYVDN